MTRGCLLVLGLMLLGVSCIGPRYPELPRAEVAAYPVKQYQLRNGLRIVLERGPDFGRAGAVLVVGAGSSADPEAKAGVAHLTEHLVLKRKLAGGVTLSEHWEALGAGKANGMTSWDSTAYLAFVPPQTLEPLLSSLAELLSDPLAGVDESEFWASQRVVRNEIRQRTENGAPGQALGWLAAEVFPLDHPYYRPVSGTPESVGALRLQDLQAFAAAKYRPEATTLAVSAPLPLKATSALVQRAFAAQLSASPAERVPAPQRDSQIGPPTGIPAKLRSYQAPVATPELWLGWSVPGAYSSRAEAAELLADMAEGTFWSNLGRRNRDIARVASGAVLGAQGGMFVLRVILKEGEDPEQSARSAARAMLLGFSERANQALWLEAIKRAVAVDATYSQESILSRVLSLAYSAHHVGEPGFLRERDARLVALTGSEVSDYYKTFLDQDRACAILIRPIAQTERAKLWSTSSTEPERGRRASARATPPSREVTRSWMRPLNVADARRTRLSTGLEVIVMPQPGSRYHTALLGYHGGRALVGARGVSTAVLWSLGGSRLSPRARGMGFGRSIALDSTTFTLRSTGSNLQRSLEALNDASGDIRVFWPPREFTDQLQVFEREDRSPPGELARARAERLFGSHPYGDRPTPRQIRQVQGKQVYGWIDAVLRPDNGVLVIVGDFEPTSALAIARETFGGFHARANRRPQVPTPPPLRRAGTRGQKRLIVRHQAGSTQAAIAFDCVLPPVTAEQSAVRLLFANMLSQRLHERLRGDLGATYSVTGDVLQLRGGTSVLRLAADVGYEHLAAALEVLRSYLAQLSAATLDAALLERARAGIVREYNLELSTTVAVAQTLFVFWNRGWPLESLQHLPDRLFETELATVLLTSESCRANWVLGLLGDETRIRSAWARAAD